MKLAAAKKPDLSGNETRSVRGTLPGGTGKKARNGRNGQTLDSRGRGEDLLFWRQLMSVQVEDHLLLAEVQQETDGVP